ncbi:MAG TPA: hypothetical protein VGM39_03985 [Kofleriaceae bacterium]
MAVLDPKWTVPDSYDITERELVLPPPRGYSGTQPLLGMLSVRAVEEQANGEGHIALFAWQVMSGAWTVASETIERLSNSVDMSGLELLVLGHAYAATELAGGVAFETAQRARKILKQPVTEHSIDASLLLAVTALPFGPERVRTLLDMLGTELEAGTALHAAVHALLRAATDAQVSLDDAYAKFVALDDHFGVAQCALVGYAREAATTKRPAVLREWLEHAVYRFEADGRPEWAARTISHALVPVLVELAVPASEMAEVLGRAIAFGVQARSEYTVESVFRTAAKLGYGARLTTLSQVEPPTFEKRDTTVVVAEEPKPKKAAAKKGGKKRAAG